MKTLKSIIQTALNNNLTLHKNFGLINIILEIIRLYDTFLKMIPINWKL